MSGLVEIRWHARGGQGAVTAAALLAEAALEQGKYFQSFPEFGPERMGAPIRAYSRVSGEPINLHCGVTAPDVVAVLDPTLIGVVDVTEGLKPGGAIIVNTNEGPNGIKKKLAGSFKVFTVDASGIARSEIGKPIPNTPMLGALLKATGLLDIKSFSGHLKKSFSSKFSREIVEGNVKALERAYEEVRS